MEVLRGIVTVIYVLLCIALIVVVLMQEGKNKGRSMEGKLVKFTKYLAIGFMALAVILNLNVF